MKGEDRISHLPDHVLHEILSLLRQKDATKTSILSKRWNSIWNSFPVLVFDQVLFRGFKRHHKKVKANFCDAMQCRYKNSIFTERLVIRIHLGRGRGTKVLKHLDSWIDCAMTMKVNQLILNLIYDNKKMIIQDEQDYVLPQCVLNSQWLRVLELNGCEFSGPNMSGIVGIGSSLRKLRLHKVRIDESTFHHVISSCFHLEDLCINSCQGFKVLSVVGLKRIHTVSLHLLGDESVFIEAPSLQFLWFHGYSSNAEKIIEACFLKKLKEIRLVNTGIEVLDEFQNFIPEFPGLEKLELRHCKLKERFTVSSGRLMSLSLIECDNETHIKLDTCCLNQLTYIGNCRLEITWIEASDEVKINHCHGLDYHNQSYEISVDKMAMYLVNLSFCKVLTLIYDGESKWIASQALDGLACNIEQLRIKIMKRHGQIGQSCQMILKEFLQISRRPSSVLIEFGEEESLARFMKLDFLYERDIDKVRLNGNCCDDSSCWRCCLRELQVSLSVNAMRGKDVTKLVEFFKANAPSLNKIHVESKADIHSQAFDWCFAPQMTNNGPPRHLVLRFR